MHVGAAHPEGAHSRPSRTVAGRPRPRRRREIEGAAGGVDVSVEPAEIGERRDLAMLQRQHGPDQADGARRGVEMADIGLGRADRAERLLGLAHAEALLKAGELDRIAERRRRAVALDIADRSGVDARHRERGRDDLGLPLHAGCGEAHLAAAVVVDGGAADDGVDVVAVVDGVGQALQGDNRYAVAEHRARRLVVERPAGPVRRHHAALLVEVAALLREGDRHTAGQRHVRLAEQQALAGLGDRQQRRRAGALHGHGRTAQVQPVGDARRQRVRQGAQQGVV